jgi:MFS family permease
MPRAITETPEAPPAVTAVLTPSPATGRLGLTAQQWKSGIAAWLGWLFDGLDMHIYTLVAAPFVAELLQVAVGAPAQKEKSAYIQAAFLVGWALGGAFFGRLGDLIGRSRSLSLTIATYACFTGLSFFAQTWWQLMAFRFLAALGIGGEWAVGSSLLSETWPAKWRAWVAAVLQTGVNLGVIVACITVWVLAGHHRAVFLVGIVPAVLVFWIRRNVPEPEEWHKAKIAARAEALLAPDLSRPPGPAVGDLFRGKVRNTTLLTIGVCSCSLTAWWAFMFWHSQHIRSLPDVATWSPKDQDRLVSIVFALIIGVSIVGNFFASFIARRLGYRRSIAMMCAGFFIAMIGAYAVPRTYQSLMFWLPFVGFFSGVFGLFTMYLPPLFPTLLRTTGAGFSYNIGRIAAAAGTIVFGLFASLKGESDLRHALLIDALLFIPAALIAMMMPELKDE